MKYCQICNASNKNRVIHFSKKLNMYLCEKHYQQYKNHGKFLDNNERTINDPNEIILHDDYAEIVLYDKHSNPIASALIDLEDIDKCKQYKWRINEKGRLQKKYYIYTGQGKNQIKLHRFIMNCNDPQYEVDHINSNTLDNRKKNLRIVLHADNTKNVSIRNNTQIQFRGVNYDERYGTYTVEGWYNYKRYYFKTFKNLAEAVYLRYLFENHFYPELRNKNNDVNILKMVSQLSETQKQNIEQYFYSKIQQ